MKLRRQCAVFLVVLASLPLLAQRQDSLPDATVAALEKSITTFMAGHSIPGLSVAVVKDGKLAWSNGYGLSDLENFVPAKADTVYRLASVSKTITATAIMQLYERGKLDLDAPVQKYCPAFPEKPWPLTTRELLGHRGGIRHYQGDEMNSTRHYDSMVEAFQIFAKDPLLFQPGTKFSYTTYGYTVLGCVLEGASGEKYIDYVQKNIFTPAGMAHAQLDDLHKIIYHRAQGYQKTKTGELLNSDLADTSYKTPGGGLVANAEDLAHYAIALENDTLLKHDTRELMWTPHGMGTVEGENYALGWGVGHGLGIRTVGHSGGQQRVSTGLMLAPEQQAAVVVLSDLEDSGALDLAEELLGIVTGAKPTANH